MAFWKGFRGSFVTRKTRQIVIQILYCISFNLSLLLIASLRPGAQVFRPAALCTVVRL
jgi:hypothetical protein